LSESFVRGAAQAPRVNGTYSATGELCNEVTAVACVRYDNGDRDLRVPDGWPDHIQWLAFMFILLARGPGKISIDALLFRD
jgi:uncharacterized membrane protein YphA (DoxX/SURF4 family)